MAEVSVFWIATSGSAVGIITSKASEAAGTLSVWRTVRAGFEGDWGEENDVERKFKGGIAGQRG